MLKSLQNIAIEFVRIVGKQKGLPASVIENVGGKIFTFGSYRLGVFGPKSDIDTLVAAPKHVTRDDFFDHFPSLLQQMAPPGSIEELVPVRDASVPIIKFKYSNISIDLIFCTLGVSSVPLSLDLKDNEYLRGRDDVELRSLNGTRVADELISLIPQAKTFRLALRAVKLWAQRRAIYGNVFGFPGGVAWALMVARICQLYPQAAGSVLVEKFFHLMSQWKWENAVMLKEHEVFGPVPNARIWNPRIYPGDARHLMPVITPAYPAMCATHNITVSTSKVLRRELARARNITSQIFQNQSQWRDLFAGHTFFTQDYKYYLAITACSRTREAQLVWSGLVESRVRRLVTGIENSQANVEVACPYVKGFTRIHRCKNEDEVDHVKQGSVEYQIHDVDATTTELGKDARQQAAAQGDGQGMDVVQPESKDQVNSSEWPVEIYTTTYYIGIELSKGKYNTHLSQHPLTQFRRQTTRYLVPSTGVSKAMH